MSPRLLYLLRKHVNGMAIAAFDHEPGQLVWTYGMNPIGRDHLRWFKELRRWEHDYDNQPYG